MGFFTEVGGGVGGWLTEGHPPPQSSVSMMLVESWVRGESAEQKEGNSGGGPAPHPKPYIGFGVLRRHQCANFSARESEERRRAPKSFAHDLGPDYFCPPLPSHPTSISQ